MQTGDFYLDPNLILPARSPSPEITYPYPLFKQEDDLKRAAMKPNQVRNVSLLNIGKKMYRIVFWNCNLQVSTVTLHGVRIVSLFMDGKERLCLAQISNTLLKDYSYNEIHNRRVALGITCVQCTPVQVSNRLLILPHSHCLKSTKNSRMQVLQVKQSTQGRALISKHCARLRASFLREKKHSYKRCFILVGNFTSGWSDADIFSKMRNDYQEGGGTIMQKFLGRQCTTQVTRKLCF